MSRKFIHIRTKNEVRVVDIPDDGFLDKVKEIIGCEYIDTAPIQESLIFLLDDSGKLEGKEYNYLASMIYPGFPMDVIVGDVLVALVGFNDGESDIVGLENEDLQFLTSLLDLGSSLYKVLDLIHTAGEDKADA